MLDKAPKLSIIVAMSNNRVIGKNKQLPWHLPEDLAYFKRITMGKPIIMGRKTFESIGRPLPGRLNIVVTHQRDWQYSGVKIAHSLVQAKHFAEVQSRIDGTNEVMVIGGEKIYQSTLPEADKIYLTQVKADIDGDAFFPEINQNLWKETSRKKCLGSERCLYNYDFCVLEKRPYKKIS